MVDSGYVFRTIEVIRRIADGLAKCCARLRYCVMFCAGAFATLALAPANFLPAFYMAMPIFVWCLAGTKTSRSAFATGWWFGFGYFVFGLYWLGYAMLVQASQHGWMIPFATLGLPAFLAIFFGAAAIPARWGQDHFSRALILATTLGAMEWLRGHVLTGFPWNLLGQAWAGQESLLQIVSLIGIYGLTFLALLSAGFLAVLAMPKSNRILIVLFLASALPIVAGTFGYMRLAQAPEKGTDWVPGIGLRLVQAGIPQRDKWRPQFLSRNFQKHLFWSLENRPTWVTHVIWPETASPFQLGVHVIATEAAVKIVPKGGALISGLIRKRGKPTRQIWNSIIALDETGKVTAHYDKFHLVPFGEYVPLQGWLPIKRISAGLIGYSAGQGPVRWQLKGLPALGPLVCYEIIFPGAVTSPHSRPKWLLVLTNDAWYGVTAGPHQHLALAQIRAVEEGLPVVRAANTGISAVFDSFGREWSRLGLREVGALDIRLPSEPPGATFYSQHSNLLVFAFLFLALLSVKYRKGIEI